MTKFNIYLQKKKIIEQLSSKLGYLENQRNLKVNLLATKKNKYLKTQDKEDLESFLDLVDEINELQLQINQLDLELSNLK